MPSDDPINRSIVVVALLFLKARAEPVVGAALG
jgi:hypothetical protein